MNELVFVTLFVLVVLVSSAVLYRQANGDYLRLVSWSTRVYFVSLAVNVVVSSLRIVNFGSYTDHKEYILIGIDILMLVLLMIIRLLLKWKNGVIVQGEQQLLTGLTLITVVIPALNIGLFISFLFG